MRIRQPKWRITLPEREKSAVSKSPATSGTMANAFAEVTGSSDPDVAMRLAQQVISVLSLPTNLSDEDKSRHIGSALKLLQQIKPQNELEGMLVTQIIAVHEATVECLQEARLPLQTPAGRDTNLKHAFKFMGLFTKQLEALDRLRGKGQQKMTVERVNVESGGQAIVGQVGARPDWPENETNEKAATPGETLEHEPSDATKSGSSLRKKKTKKAASKKVASKKRI